MGFRFVRGITQTMEEKAIEVAIEDLLTEEPKNALRQLINENSSNLEEESTIEVSLKENEQEAIIEENKVSLIEEEKPKVKQKKTKK